MIVISEKKFLKANKEHKCNFCCQKILVGTHYDRQVNKNDGDFFTWKSHVHCSSIVATLRMYDLYANESGLTSDDFQEAICDEFNAITNTYSSELSFQDRLDVVLRHYNIPKI